MLKIIIGESIFKRLIENNPQGNVSKPSQEINEITGEIDSEGEYNPMKLTWQEYFEYNNPKNTIDDSLSECSTWKDTLYNDGFDYLKENGYYFEYYVNSSKMLIAYYYKANKSLYINKNINFDGLNDFIDSGKLTADNMLYGYNLNNVDIEKTIVSKNVLADIIKDIDTIGFKRDIKPSSDQILQQISKNGYLFKLVACTWSEPDNYNLLTRDEVRLGRFNEIADNFNVAIIHNGIMVAKSYTNFKTISTWVSCDYSGYGFGKLVATKIRELLKNTIRSGGQTSQGYDMLRRIWKSAIKKGLASGFYDNAIENGALSKEKVKDIIQSYKSV